MNTDTPSWAARPYILAILLAFTGLIFHFSIHGLSYIASEYNQHKVALACFTLTASVLFSFSFEKSKWGSALIFSAVAALVVAGISYWSVTPRNNSLQLDFPFWSGLVAAGIALPFFQSYEKRADHKLLYSKLQTHAWKDVILWCASWVFVGTCFLSITLAAELFSLIGIEILEKLIDQKWFISMFVGLTFGAGVGLLKENQRLLESLFKLVIAFLTTLTPFFCAFLAVFLFSTLATGLNPLWKATNDSALVLLSCIVGAIILINTVVRSSSEDESPSKLLQISASGLCISILPLTLLAFLSIKLRVDQYGLTPDRIWGLLCVVVAFAYGIVYLISALLKRKNWTEHVRRNNVRLALTVCGVATLLATPIVDFSKIATENQINRLNQGQIEPEKFDLAALAFAFGNSGRDALKDLSNHSNTFLANGAKKVLSAENPWSARKINDNIKSEITIKSKLNVYPNQVEIPELLVDAINESAGCASEYCALVWDKPSDTARLIYSNSQHSKHKSRPFILEFRRSKNGLWEKKYDGQFDSSVARSADKNEENKQLSYKQLVENGDIQIRTVQRKQIFIGGIPVGRAFQ